MLKGIAADCLKYNFPQINTKTQIVMTEHSRIETVEERTPESRAVKKETYFSRLFKVLFNKEIEPALNLCAKVKIRTAYFKELEFGYRHVRATMLVYYDNVSDTLYVNIKGYTDIDLKLVREI